MEMSYLLASAFISALIGTAFGLRKDRAVAGFVLGLILGPIGWLLIAIGPDYSEKPNAPATPSAPAGAEDATAALLNLKKLLDAQAISAAEYETKKSQLLARIG